MSYDIRVFKLINGDEIVGNVKEKMEGINTVYSVSKPRQMVIVQNTAKGPVSGLIPWVLSAPDATIELTKDKIFSQAPVTKDVEDYYFEVTSSIALVA